VDTSYSKSLPYVFVLESTQIIAVQIAQTRKNKHHTKLTCNFKSYRSCIFLVCKTLNIIDLGFFPLCLYAYKCQFFIATTKKKDTVVVCIYMSILYNRNEEERQRNYVAMKMRECPTTTWLTPRNIHEIYWERSTQRWIMMH